jgi:hypothetical protein
MVADDSFCRPRLTYVNTQPSPVCVRFLTPANR